MSLRRAAHAVWDCQYHLMWTPKRRRAIFTGEVAARVETIFRESAEAYDIEILEFGLGVDHLHFLCAFAPRFSVSQVVMRLKSLTARRLFSEFPYLRHRFPSNELWEGSYFVRTVGSGVDAQTVSGYISRHTDDVLEEASDFFDS